MVNVDRMVVVIVTKIQGTGVCACVFPNVVDYGLHLWWGKRGCSAEPGIGCSFYLEGWVVCVRWIVGFASQGRERRKGSFWWKGGTN